MSLTSSKGTDTWLEADLHGASRWFRETEQFEDERRGNLIGCVGDAHVKGWVVDLDGISQQDLEAIRLGRPLHALCDCCEVVSRQRGHFAAGLRQTFGRHARIHFDGCDRLALFQDAYCQVTGAGTDLEHVVASLEVGLVHNGGGDAGVLEDVLAEVGVHLEDAVGDGRFRRWPGVRRRLGAASLGPVLGHGGEEEGKMSVAGGSGRNCTKWRLASGD